MASENHFLVGFCSPDLTLGDFGNELGRFTPCFVDVAVLGTAEVFCILVCVLHLLRTFARCGRKHRYTGVALRVQVVTLALCCAGLLISLAQLNARLGAAAAAAWGGLGLLGQQSSAAATHNTLTLGEGSDVPQPAATAAAAEVAAALSRRALRAMLGAWVRGSGGDDGGGGGGDATAPVAPYEWAGFALSSGRWLALVALFSRELVPPGHVVLPARWLVRFALVLAASAELVKARFLIFAPPPAPSGSGSGPGSGSGSNPDSDPDSGSDGDGAAAFSAQYFFYMYVSYLSVQLALAGLALVWRPGKATGLVEAEDDQHGGGYLPLAGSEPDTSAAAATATAAAAAATVCPEARAGIWSSLTFAWMAPLIQKGYRQPLTTNDIWQLPPDDRVDAVEPAFQKLWRAELASHGAAGADLGRACWRLVAAEVLWALPAKALNDGSQFVGPLFLNMLLQVLATGGPSWRGYAAAGCMFVGSAVGVLADNQHFQRVMRAGFRLKAALAAAVHAQLFRLTPAARSHFSSGRVYSLVASDVESLMALCQNVMGLFSSPVRIVVALVLLYGQLGAACLTAVAVLVALVPANAAIVAASNRALKDALGHTDERTKLEAEMMAGMEVVKCSAWEQPLQDRIEAARSRELSKLWRVSVLSSLVTFLLLSVPVLIPVTTFGVYLALGHSLDAAKAFTCLVLFNVLRFPLFQLPQLVAQLSAARVSLGRLRDFLAAESADPAPPLPAAQPGATAVRLTGDFGWDPKQPPALVDLDLDVKAGQLVAVVGSTGSGKSTLISAILGTAQQVYGSPPYIAGRLAYVPQSPFIINATVRDNILFGLPYQPERYAAALAGACLGPDLAQLAGGDMTEMGDRGVNVSGGQKQRLAIARALYADADVVLLDDPLSALDAAVGRRVFEAGVVRGLLKDKRKAVVMATNQLHFVRQADIVVVLSREGGRVAECGPPAQLLAAGGAFAALMKEAEAEQHAHEQEQEQEGAAKDKTTEAKEGVGAVAAEAKPNGEQEAEGAKKAAAATAAEGGGGASAGATAAPPQQGQVVRITADERSGEGVTVGTTMAHYLSAMPMPLGLGAAAAAAWLLGGFAASEALRVATTVWLAQWTGSPDNTGGGGGDPDPDAEGRRAMWYLGVYGAISAVQLAVQAVNTLDVSRLGLGAARKLHSRLLASLLGAPMSFFHATPLGRIVNRLTKDTSDIDRNLAPMSAMAARSALQLVSTLALVGAVAPFALPALVVILAAFYWLYQYFQASVRQVKRLDAVARSPVMSSLTEALTGTSTYIAYGAQARATARHRVLLDGVSCMALVSQSLNRWLSVRLEVLGAAAALAAGCVAVEQRAGPGAAGLVMSYALQVTAAVSITVRTASMAETMLNAVERVVEYCDLPQEGNKQLPPAPPSSGSGSGSTGSGSSGSGSGSQQAPPPGWPAAGCVEFKNVALRYRPGLPLVLRGVSFKAEARDKIGVVGRTGAGKSSLLGCLFRLVEVERGQVLIDDVDISKLALRQLRARLSLIPQVPVLFTGSIRANLSPFGAHTDAELWGALRRAHLAPVVEGWAGGLDTELAEGGAPLSAGQKQLLALARALLNPAKVLVLDEATANVDVETDALIQSTLRSQFPDRTLLTIAHRLATIIDYSRILLLEQGRVVEYDTPSALLSRPDSAFGRLVDETGPAAAAQLRRLAAGGGGAVQEMLDAPAKAALVRLTSFSSPAAAAAAATAATAAPQPGGAAGSSFFSRASSIMRRSGRLLSGGGGGGGGLMPADGGCDFAGGGGGVAAAAAGGGDESALAALQLDGRESLAQLAALVAGRSCAVVRTVKSLRQELEQYQAQQSAAAAAAAAVYGGGVSVGAAVDDVALVLGAAGGGGGGGGGGGSDSDGDGGAAGGGGGGVGGGAGRGRRGDGGERVGAAAVEGSGVVGVASAATVAAARLALVRCVALLEEARAGAAALGRALAAAGLGDVAPAAAVGGGVAGGEAAASAPESA
ncbi:hypothetical protein CHLRE_04g228650v5 [Chlamydomonas reinhardtii]|uniref:Uncharacterized protein n=1 Tax=Chlamydomonas reinhardtii TaxID=3055 RepID=A0A2K3DUU4_CHLRE|nr:uncharacterized protein CHLRE_04g228650v5 [Chlamydomonas reinhardtii]PNW84295.1 hypothetical protein CHLRE_04g228650v5 [Chlamydomonas reinhardtii]